MTEKQKSKQKNGKNVDGLPPLARQLARKLPDQALETKRIGAGKHDHLKQETYQGLRKAAEMFKEDSENPSREQLQAWVQACKNVR